MPTHIHLKTRDDLSHSDLTALLSYDSKTGIFRWKEGRGGRPAGTIAGNRNKLNGYTIIRLGDLYFRAHVLATFTKNGRTAG